MLGDIIKLRASMKPYFSAQFDLLNATGRPFNRPLTWDFPDDPTAWLIYENGIGNGNGSAPNTPHKPAEGDFVVLDKCVAGAWNQQFSLQGTMLVLASKVTAGMCVDNGGSTTSGPPDGPYPVHMWGCAGQWSRAQTWTYGAANKSLSDPKSVQCLAVGADPAHPVMAGCNPADAAQQWTFSPAGGPIVSVGGACLSVVPATSGPTSGVADQYMMGDGYMAAPILNLGQRSRPVYFPHGADWEHHYTGTLYKGGTTETVDAPLDTFPLFKRLPASP